MNLQVQGKKQTETGLLCKFISIILWVVKNSSEFPSLFFEKTRSSYEKEIGSAVMAIYGHLVCSIFKAILCSKRFMYSQDKVNKQMFNSCEVWKVNELVYRYDIPKYMEWTLEKGANYSYLTSFSFINDSHLFFSKGIYVLINQRKLKWWRRKGCAEAKYHKMGR